MDTFKNNSSSLLIGKGGQANVYLVYNEFHGKLIALKRAQTESSKAAFDNELSLIDSFSHPNIIRSLRLNGPQSKIPASEGLPCFALELSNLGSLFEYVNVSGKGLSERLTRLYLLQTLDALEVVHKAGYAHLDFKLENLLLFGSGEQIKLTDFGSCEKFEDQVSTKLKHFVGTDGYMAPEILKKEDIGPKTDVFSFGVVLYIMITGSFPFKKASSTDPRYKWLILGKGKKMFSQITSKTKVVLEDSLQALLTCMWDPDPKRRLSLEDIRCSEWMNGEVASLAEAREFVASLKRTARRGYIEGISGLIANRSRCNSPMSQELSRVASEFL